MTTRKRTAQSQALADNEAACLGTETARNGELIRWEYWASLRNISAAQGARLAHCIDPIKWPDDRCAAGAISENLRVRIAQCQQWLEQQTMPASLGNLVLLLGGYAPFTMRRGAAEVLATIEAGRQEVAATTTKSTTNVNTQETEPRTYTTKGARSNILKPIIDKAREAASNPNDYQQVWPQLVRLAQSNERPPPLTGYAENEGVLYEDATNPCKAFTKNALRKRLARLVL